MKNMKQQLPLRIRRSAGRITITAPMPGLSPEEINVTITNDAILIHGEKKSAESSENHADVIANEWAIGPYERSVQLPEAVRGDLANATYGNGVFVLSLPITNETSTVGANFQVHPVSPTHGERIGHAGQEINPLSADEHLRKHR